MKKFAIFTLALSLCTFLLVGCGCMNTGEDVPTLPTNGESSAPTTAVTTEPTTMPTTAATTEAPTEAPTDTTGTLEGAMDDIVGGSTDDATDATDAGRSRTRGNGPRIP